MNELLPQNLRIIETDRKKKKKDKVPLVVLNSKNKIPHLEFVADEKLVFLQIQNFISTETFQPKTPQTLRTTVITTHLSAFSYARQHKKKGVKNNG